MHVYFSLGRCPLTWPVTGQSLRNPLYCTPRGLVTGHQRLDQEDELGRRDSKGQEWAGQDWQNYVQLRPRPLHCDQELIHPCRIWCVLWHYTLFSIVSTQIGTQDWSFTCAISMLSITGLMLLVVLIGWVCQAHCRLLGRGRRDKYSRPILESRGNPWHTSIIWQPCNRVSRKYFNSND